MFVPTGNATECPVQSDADLMTLLFEELNQMDPAGNWTFAGSLNHQNGSVEYTFDNSYDDRLATIIVDRTGVIEDSWTL
mgnify:CR=1 FL=1